MTPTAVIEALLAAAKDAPQHAEALTQVGQELARLYVYIERLEAADSQHLLTILDRNGRLARVSAELDTLYAETVHDLGDAANRHRIVTRARALTDLATPLSPTLYPRTTPLRAAHIATSVG